jgi:hypothetical protein
MSYTWSILDFWITNHFKLYGPICLPARAAWLTGCSFLYLVGWKAWRARLGTALKEFGIPTLKAAKSLHLGKWKWGSFLLGSTRAHNSWVKKGRFGCCF